MPTLYLVRHAQPDFGGHYDSVTALGERQSAWLGMHYRSLGVRFDRVLSGALARQRETLRILCEQLPDAPEPVVDPRFDEYDAGRLLRRFAGKVDRELRGTADRRAYFTTLRDTLHTWAAHEGPLAPDETWIEFGARIHAGVRDCQRELGRDAKVLIVTSGGVIGRYVADLLGADASAAIALNLQARNTGVTEVVSGRSTSRLVVFNAIPHLEQPERAHALTYS